MPGGLTGFRMESGGRHPFLTRSPTNNGPIRVNTNVKAIAWLNEEFLCNDCEFGTWLNALDAVVLELIRRAVAHGAREKLNQY